MKTSEKEKAIKEFNRLRNKEEAIAKPTSPLEKKLDNLVQQRNMLQDVIKEAKAGKLSKYAGKNGLGEVTGEKGGIWKSMGDEKAMDLGYPSTEAARIDYENHQLLRLRLKDMNEEIASVRRELAASRLEDREAKSLNYLLNKTATKTELEIARQERLADIKKEEQKTQERLRQEQAKSQTLQDKINKAKLEGSKPTGFFKELYRSLYPSRALDNVSKPIVEKWFKKTVESKQLGFEAYTNAIPKGIQTFQEIVDFQAGKQTPYIREAFDEMGTDFTRRGLSFDWMDNYMPDVWKDSNKAQADARVRFMKEKGMSDKEVEEYLSGVPLDENKALRLKLRPNFVKERFWPDYVTGMKYGLRPKYTIPADLIGYYKEAGERAIANIELINELKTEARLLLVAEAPDTWIPITTRFAREGLSAPPALADLINGKFRDENNLKVYQKILKVVSTGNKFLQNLKLSGGIPFTPYNYFTASQAWKLAATTLGDITTLKFRNMLTSLRISFAFVRSLSNFFSSRYFKSELPTITMMAKNGFDLSDRVGGQGYQTVYNQFKTAFNMGEITNIKTLGSIGKNIWHKAIDEKTFKSLMVQIKIELFKSSYNSAITSGMEEEMAQQFASKVTRVTEGVIEETGRSETTKETLGSVLFAPQYREGLVNIFLEGARGWSTQWSNPAYSRPRSFIAGIATAFALYQLVNLALNDEYTWDNPPGRELSIRYKLPNGDIAYFDLGPGLLSTPRNLILGTVSTAKGDFDTAKQKFGSLLSMGLQTATQVWSNKDYFGNPIYSQTDEGTTKTKKIAAYVGLETSHPYVAELYKYVSGKQPMYWSLVNMAELPVKLTNMTKEQSSRYYDALDKKAKEQARAKEEMMPIYQEIRDLNAGGRTQEAIDKYMKLTDEQRAIYKSLKSSEKSKLTTQRKIEIQTIYDNIQQLKYEGRIDEANIIYSSLSPEDMKAYQAIKKLNQ